ncbi:methyl-accepting chemotaxis protein [Paracoccus luteus]|uniref:methyl-accepting chemotaxis protein n=1 Tax=Paracoccus luteus TaxID=2508543 RepID=UPI0010700AF6|nr:PAS domain-containing methyl-accepting chemotaxis protein [Paracoccus luteus]
MSAGKFTHPDLDQAMTAIEAVQSVLSFTMDGVITEVNDNYLKMCGFRRDELVGSTLARLMDPDDETTKAHPEFWARLRAGETQVGEFKRIAKAGHPFWISAIYTPVRDATGTVTQVVVFAIDITGSKRTSLRGIRKVDALARSQAVVEFTPTGEIVAANEGFLNLMGYTLDEIRGRHHRIFMPSAEVNGADYARLWADLARGVSHSGEFQRRTRSGQTVWLSASYVPVLDEVGCVESVMKIAIDITAGRTAVDSLIHGLGRLARGDLTARLGDTVAGEFEGLREQFNTTLDSFSHMADDIRSHAEQMNGEAGQIARGASDLARRGESQAASLEQTAAAVEEISGNITMTSQAARDADAAARDAQAVVLRGAEVVGQAIAAIERIDEHTKQMGEFTRVIEGFAFQTNLLSINAAVEAARAGEVGRGFAVVANEVRNLAQQSAKASQNIADLIGKSETEVKAGVKLVRDAGISLDQIRTAVSGVVENITGIAHATTEQSTGVREVSQALAQLDGVNQANLSMSEQYASAAASLLSQIEELGAMMERFHTDKDTALATPPARRAA